MEPPTEEQLLAEQQRQLKIAKLCNDHNNWLQNDDTKFKLDLLKALYQSRINDAEVQADKDPELVRLLVVEARAIKDVIAKLQDVNFVINWSDKVNKQ